MPEFDAPQLYIGSHKIHVNMERAPIQLDEQSRNLMSISYLNVQTGTEDLPWALAQELLPVWGYSDVRVACFLTRFKSTARYNFESAIECTLQDRMKGIYVWIDRCSDQNDKPQDSGHHEVAVESGKGWDLPPLHRSNPTAPHACITIVECCEEEFAVLEQLDYSSEWEEHKKWRNYA